MSGSQEREIFIRPARSHSDLHGCVDLQAAVWGFDTRDIVPFHQLHAAHEWGGLVLVAEAGERLVGFSYAFSGRQHGRPALLSHMLAVLPDYRGRDLGARMKQEQGRWAQANGYDLITWTYDPLLTVNANLNIARLGGVVRRYLADHYGPMTDGTNRGLPSDRLLVEWHLNSPRVQAVLQGERAVSVSPERTCRILRNMGALKERDPEAALRERLRVRDEICAAFGAGFVISGFQMDEQFGTYLLNKESE